MKKILPYISNFVYTVIICFLVTTAFLGVYLFGYQKTNSSFDITSVKKTLSNLFVLIYPLVLFIFAVITKKFAVLRLASLFVPLSVCAFIFAVFKYFLNFDSLFHPLFFALYVALPSLFLLLLSRPLNLKNNIC